MLERVFATPARDFENAPPEEQERVLRIVRGAMPLEQRGEGLWNDLAIVTSSRDYALERLGVPTLVIGIEDDLFGTYKNGRRMAERIPGARFLGFPTGGHLWVGRQNEIAAELAAFLNRAAEEKYLRTHRSGKAAAERAPDRLR